MATGKVVQVIGTVVDIEFPADELPNLFDALELDNVGEKLVLEMEVKLPLSSAPSSLVFFWHDPIMHNFFIDFHGCSWMFMDLCDLC